MWTQFRLLCSGSMLFASILNSSVMLGNYLQQTTSADDILDKVGRSKPPPVLTSGFNRLKPPRSICQKVVNTGHYESEWSIENSKGRFCGELRYLYMFYVLSIEKRKKNTVLSLPRALFMVRFPSQDLSTEFCITVHAPNTSLFSSSRAE